jgi:hypothetical protein
MVRDRWLAAIFVCLAALLAAAPASAETMALAEFVGGGSNASPINTVVDAYTGMAGDGWAGPWAEAKTATAFTVATSTASPLHTGPGGDLKYLDLTVTQNTATSIKYGVTARNYTGTGGADVTKPHAIDFKYRVDETLAGSNTFTTFNDRYQIFDARSSDNTVNANSSWFISCYGGTDATNLPDANMVGKWLLFDGGGHDSPVDTGLTPSREVNTGITVTTGTIYDFHVDVDPATYTYDVTIGSGGTKLYDSTVAFPEGLGWRTSAATVQGIVHFNGCCMTGNDVRHFSFDELKISQIPEPSMFLLVVSAGLASAACVRRGR